MSRLLLGIGLTVAIGAGLVGGWFIAEPKDAAHAAPAPVAGLHNKVAPAPAASLNATAGGDDQSEGWQGRKDLRDHLTLALGQIKADPCKSPIREAFLAAYAERALAEAKDVNGGAGQAVWSTVQDQSLKNEVAGLEKAGYVTEPELNMAVAARSPTSSQTPVSGPPAPSAPVLESSTCRSELAVLR